MFRPNGYKPTSKFLLLAFCALVILSAKTFGQSCDVRATVEQNTNVFARSPVFSTSRGWDYGSPVASLSKGTTIYICHEETVRFGFQSQRWAQISYFMNGGWQFGWVRQAALVTGNSTPSNEQSNSRSLVSRIFVSNVQAAVAPNVPRGDKTPPAGLSPPNVPANLSVQSYGESVTDISVLKGFYIGLFLSMVGGMLAKCIFDYIQVYGTSSVKGQFREILTPLLISPIVFLALMQAADTSAVGMKAFIVLNLMAFQNGFFWQTIFGENNAGIAKLSAADR
jgi:hypothetical protein